MMTNNNRPTQPKTAVVVLNWNGRKLLEEFLPTVVENTPADAARIIVADNGSTDDSIPFIASRWSEDEVEIIPFDTNYGFAEGYNRAIAMLRDRYEYVILLNSDIAATPGWIEPLIDFMDANNDVAACAPKLKSYTDPSRFEYAGASGGFLDRHGFPYCRGRIFDTCETDIGQYDSVIDVDWATGAALTVRTDLYLEVGGLDPRFFAHMEEIDLCWRLRRRGFRIAVVPDSTLFHLGGGSLPPSDPRKTYLNYRNNLIMLHKNLPPETRQRIILRRRLLDTVAWGMNILTFKWGVAAAILRAHRDFRRMRADFKPRTDRADENDRHRRPNIIVDYFLRRRHTFDSLNEK